MGRHDAALVDNGFQKDIIGGMENTLADLRPGQSAYLRQIGGDRAFRRRLMELGFVPGTEVKLTKVAPLGDPLEFMVRQSRISIRRQEARAIVAQLK